LQRSCYRIIAVEILKWRIQMLANVRNDGNTDVANVWRSDDTLDFARGEATAAPFKPSRQNLFGSVREMLRTWKERVRSRGELSQLTPRDLGDIGMSHTHAQWESRKPFWRA
jgi:uncharacterized protein YjiS (DUF1127 family)